MRRVFLLISGFITAIAAADPATAATVDVTYTGTVSTTIAAYDLTDIFGTGSGFNNTLAGMPFTVTFTYNSTGGQPGAQNNPPSFYQIFGGTSTGFPTPGIAASVTINGHTVDVAGSNETIVEGCNTGPSSTGCPEISNIVGAASTMADQFTDGTGGYSPAPTISVFSQLSTFVSSSAADLPANIGQPFSETFSAADSATGTIQLHTCDTTVSCVPSQSIVDTTVTLTPTAVSVTYSENVPEPASWGMMLAGLGLLVGLRMVRTVRP